jgi:two-component system chemotaxis sensor kinase CheA
MQLDVRALLRDFAVEAQDHLHTIERTLVLLEQPHAGAGIDPALSQALRGFHSIKGSAGFLELDPIVEVAHEAESVVESLRHRRTPPDSLAVTHLLGAVDYLTRATEQVAAGRPLDALRAEVPSILEALRSAAPRSAFPLDSTEGAEALPDLSFDAEIPMAFRPVDTGPQAEDRGATLRVDVHKLDQLMNLVGELLLAETMVTQNEDLRGVHLPSFTKSARALNRITRALQDLAMSVRMVPISATFHKMHRLVRDTSKKLGKQAELAMYGESTEIDKNLVDRLADPLIHLIRNAVDHGLESPADRIASGKPASGVVTLEATHQSGEVWVTVRDDGRGLQRDKILARAMELGVMPPGPPPTDPELFALIFEPGFSTAQALSDVSGRGVGMDIVRRSLEEIGGRVEVASEPGLGTTVTIKIPLTLAIIDGMLVRVGEQRYTIPVLAVQESVRGRGVPVHTLPEGGEWVNLRGLVVPIVRLGQVFDPSTPFMDVNQGILILCQHGGAPVCLLVDELLGQRQTVIKALPSWLGARSGFLGCSILSNGDVSLILDLGRLIAHPSRLRAA